MTALLWRLLLLPLILRIWTLKPITDLVLRRPAGASKDVPVGPAAFAVSGFGANRFGGAHVSASAVALPGAYFEAPSGRLSMRSVGGCERSLATKNAMRAFHFETEMGFAEAIDFVGASAMRKIQ